MKITTHYRNGAQIAEVTAEGRIIQNAADGLDLLGNVYYQGYDHVAIHRRHIADEFFDLKTGIAGEILQKFSNYRVRLTVIGDFSDIKSKSWKDFMTESNRGRLVNFLPAL